MARMVDRTGNWSAAADSVYQNLSAVQESSSSIVFWSGGQWLTDSACSGDLCHFGGAARRSSTSGSWVAYGFTGSQIAWVSKRAPDGGYADVYIDGYLQTTVNLNQASADYRRVVFSKTWTSPAQHSIEIRLFSNGSYVPMDAFLVVS